ncbi:MAG: DUF4143 domain-containing protein [Gemmatimonadaceae bacterium]|jgi:hypothetical protein|nr:DUF4143 domain-containing protein [Gemmatimonadaceae bacterium]
MFAPRIDPPTVARLWSMLAHAHGTQVHAARLAAGLGVSAPTVTSYIDLLERLLLVRRLRPWSGNVGKRLVRTPKTYLRDSGVLHALLALDRWDAVLGHPIAGTSWEGFAIEALIVAAGPDRTPLFYRTEDGAEIDLVFERGGRVEYAIEIKRSMAPTLSRGATSALSVLEPGRAVVVHGGTGRWALRDSVDAMSVADLARELREGA